MTTAGLRVADYVAARLSHLGVTDAFVVTGGAAMHLDHAFAEFAALRVHYLHHEQACAMAAEGFARLDWRPAAVVVTAGPGVINALNGVFGAYTDSIPMIVISGQVRTNTLAQGEDLRQMGDQEVRTLDLVRSLTVWRHQLSADDDLRCIVDSAYLAATGGRPGPAWLDIPVDLQSQIVELDPCEPILQRPKDGAFACTEIDEVIQSLEQAERPLILAGTGVRASDTMAALLRTAELLDVPVMTAWTHDVMPNEHRLFVGRPGTIGTRDANIILQQADVLVVLGSRLNIRQVSYNWASFARQARIIHVDIDQAELVKPFLDTAVKVKADLREFLPALGLEAQRHQGRHTEWIAWCQRIRAEYGPKWDDYSVREEGINPYHLVMSLGDCLRPGDVMVCGNATACIVPFQVLPMREGIRMFSNSGSASMGYDLPAALGAAVAAEGSQRRVICLAGDGSLMMNLQELQTLASSELDIALIILVNDGYLSIRQTQANFFGSFSGCGPSSGLQFPDFARIGSAFGLVTMSLEPTGDWRQRLSAFLDARGPRVCVASIDRHQEFEPRLRSIATSEGIKTPELDNMHPLLPEAQLAAIRASAPRRRAAM